MRIYVALLVTFVAFLRCPQAQVSAKSSPTDGTQQTTERTTPAATQSVESPNQYENVDVTDLSHPSSDSDALMVTPEPVSTLGYSMEFSSEIPRSNYFGTGLTFGTGYEDAILMATHPVTDVSYSIRPSIAWSKSTPRVSWKTFYSPGFTFYQRNSSLNESEQRLDVEGVYRFSPHVALTVQDRFYKTSNALASFEQNAKGPVAETNGTVATVVVPFADQITNVGSAQVTYQFAPNSMVGVNGEFSGLYYLNSTEATRLLDSRTRAAKAFFTRRFSGRQYIGVSYGYQNLVSTPDGADTETHGVALFYTFYFRPKRSISIFGGAQHANSFDGNLMSVIIWSPLYGGSFRWDWRSTSLALRAGQSISGGGGLEGAVRGVYASGSLRQGLTKKTTAQLTVNYSNNTPLAPLPAFSEVGRTISGTVFLEHQVREDFKVTFAYTRLRQDYPNFASIAPDQNRVSLSLTYELTKPIGK